MSKLFEMPMVRISVERMQQNILAALADYNEELSNFVEDEIEKAIDEFDFTATVQNTVQKSIQQAIDNYFKYGEGWTAVQSAVGKALDEIFKP